MLIHLSGAQALDKKTITPGGKINLFLLLAICLWTRDSVETVWQFHSSREREPGCFAGFFSEKAVGRSLHLLVNSW